MVPSRRGQDELFSNRPQQLFQLQCNRTEVQNQKQNTDQQGRVPTQLLYLKAYCASYDGNLASVHNIWEFNFLQRLVQTGGHTLAWIGGYYFEGAWRWVDGSVFNYHKWGSVSSTDIYQCLHLNSQGQIPVLMDNWTLSTRNRDVDRSAGKERIT
ncbi:Ladderlectin [Liparis tanakae]|uniref:Ladderlectin n=1 Tax=Liparis tanakae TaxID=230148 RepID=A0A4Z2GBU4_9TELE|nr:Ladderlectin [Liparis tanakae]